MVTSPLSFPAGASLGVWNSIDDLWAIELASKELDFVILDLEHGFRDFSRFSSAFLSLSARRRVLVRLRSDQDPWLQSLLDLGVTDLLIPQVETPGQVARFVRTIDWPPHGSRGYHPRSRVPPPSHGGTLQQVAVIPIIEKRSALESCQQILELEGVSGLYFGAFDLSVDLGLSGPADSKITSYFEQVAQGCHGAGKDFLSMPMNQAQVDAAVLNGFTEFVAGIDLQLLIAGVARVTGRG